MFVINPDPYSLPCYRIGPFKTRDISINYTLPDNDLIDDYFNDRFGDRDFIYTRNGREAINIALCNLNLTREDVVTIFTSSGNFYISGCVTKEIEKFCKWSREIETATKVIFVNHEFGYPFPALQNVKKYNLPIIEDCAGSFFSQNENNDIGNVGDHVIYSFPKMFPIQIGGLLVSKFTERVKKEDQERKDIVRYIKNILSSQIQEKQTIIQNRVSNYFNLKEKFEALGLQERFIFQKGIVPGVFMFRTDAFELDQPELKKYFLAHGIQSSIFYGENAFFIPVHQALSEQDMLYFVEVMKSFLSK